VVCAALVAVVGVAGSGAGRAPRAESTRAAGVLSQSNSKDGSAILSASNIGPGNTSSGTVTIKNTGTLAGAFELGKSGLSDLVGLGGGALSGALSLRVEEVTAGREIYRGQLSDMPTRPLGIFQPGESHTYRYTVGMPDRGGAIDNTFEGGATTVQYDWTVRPAPVSAPAKPAGPVNDLKRRAPKVTVKVPRRQRIIRQRGIYLRVRCDKPCTVDIRVRVKGSVRIGSPPWRLRRKLPGGRTVRAKVRIPRRDLARLRVLLAHSPSIRILVAANAKDPNGASRGAVKASASVPGR
jgi:hypothetical protein